MVIGWIQSFVLEEGTGEECMNVLKLSKFACVRRGGKPYRGLDIMCLLWFRVNLRYFARVIVHVCEVCPGYGSALRKFALVMGKSGKS